MTQRVPFPFTALVGQPDLRLALMLNAVNPRLGGVLIRGEKGTAKSTAARALAALLPPLKVIDGCRFGCDPDAPATWCDACAAQSGAPVSRERPAALVELPIGATEDRVLGTLDIERALQSGTRHFEPGLLARANRGVLYVDEVNLLPDHLVDALLDAAALGVHTVEREGISVTHPAAFVLVGTMNPEEGDVRPQLLDRFALTVEVVGLGEPAERAEVVRRRIAYESDPVGFAARFAETEAETRARIVAARQRLPAVVLRDDLLELIARCCVEFEVDGLRADIVIYKAAVTLAAWAARDEVTPEDIQQAAELALPHRRRRTPFDTPGLDRDRLADLIHAHTPPAPPSPPESSEGDAGAPPPEPSGSQSSARRSAGGAGDHLAPPPEPSERDAFPPRPAQGRGGPGGSGSSQDPAPLDPFGPSPRVFDAAFPPVGLRLLLPRPLSAAPQPRSAPRARRAPGGPRPTESPRGRHIRSTPVARPTRAPDLPATLRAAALTPDLGAPSHPLRVRPADLRYKVRVARHPLTTLFVVDASGSMAAQQRMAAAKGAILALLTRAYQQRDRVGLIAFRGTAAELVLPPTDSADLAVARLRALPTGGRTPLADALRLAQQTFGPTPGLLVVVSDGRANVAHTASGDPRQDALAAARALAAAGHTALVVDAEAGPLRLGLATTLAAALGARYLHLADLPADGRSLARAVETLRSHG